MSTIAILGTGRMAVRLADLLLHHGHRVVLGSRSAPRAQTVAGRFASPRISGTTYREAASAPEVEFVLPAIFIRDGLFAQLEPLADVLRGKILIDILNPFNDDYSDFILPWDTSAAEELQRRFPDSTVVGGFKNVFWETFENPDFAECESDVYFVADDERARQQVMALFAHSPFRLVDAGGLKNARIVERMTLFAAELGSRRGYLPRVGWRLLGEPWTPGVRDRYAALIQRGATD